MKRILLFSLVSIALVSSLLISSCRKKYNEVSLDVTVSYPVLTLLNGQYYSIPVGGILPATAVIATAYDTFYKQTCPVVVDFTGVTNFSAGIYSAQVSAKNTWGFTSYATIYIGVTDISDTLNLSGNWINNFTGNEYTIVSQVATGMFTTTNLWGVDVVASPDLVTPSFFLVTSPTTIVFPSAASDLTTGTATLSMIPYDTTIVYGVNYTGTPVTVSYLK